MQDINYSREYLSNVLAAAYPILEKQKNELAPYDDLTLKPDISGYITLEENGGLRIYTVRIDDKLVGYSVFILCHNMHYKYLKQAVNDIFYIDKQARGDGLGRMLIQYSEDQLKQEDINIIIYHVKEANPYLGEIAEAEGYPKLESIYQKRLS